METDFVPFEWHSILLGEQPPSYLLDYIVHVDGRAVQGQSADAAKSVGI